MMKIRKAKRGDIERILVLCRKLEEIHRPKNQIKNNSFMINLMKGKREILEKDMASGQGAVFFAEHEENLMGYIFVVKSHYREVGKKGTPGFISDLYIEKKHRKNNLGVKLIREAEKWLRSKGKKNVYLSVEAWNTGAVSFYRKLKFKDKSIKMEKKL